MSDWSNFVSRCSDNVRKIHDTNDEGVYAKLYAADVSLLLAMVQAAVDYYPEGIVPETVFSWMMDGTIPKRTP